VLANTNLRQHFHRYLFRGYDFDNTMLPIGSMNMLAGVEIRPRWIGRCHETLSVAPFGTSN